VGFLVDSMAFSMKEEGLRWFLCFSIGGVWMYGCFIWCTISLVSRACCSDMFLHSRRGSIERIRKETYHSSVCLSALSRLAVNW